MFRTAILGLVGFVALAFVAPQVSKAQTPVGVQVQVGPAGVIYQRGYPVATPGCVTAAPVAIAPSVTLAAPGYWNGYRHVHYVHHGYHGHHRHHL